ncbi:hypothetical protein TPHA_0I00580 [Tetrapisispora phaffii CBS 4417]|uniref:Altered inheritance of mitochondria protein 39, mitochondrial n=1 Tax=Tetrapisispora phaffii (strain ATCC 24235 / CBS 4417 / NBRC 1672 / NRRL Y-8282 / UCD 70-5) TaxID=1071381 RepID=G8BXD6_TETPH|nr:hypothetical protein TPHA_0I00580 [Tetrapisispora phaffii CBS 4417]CCE64564.1 hypothetical protein TPHA_0I00580 [Tetrapisispora phaffii CBS 4417]
MSQIFRKAHLTAKLGSSWGKNVNIQLHLKVVIAKRVYSIDNGKKNDSKYMFSKPPFTPRNKETDTKHFFTKPRLFETFRFTRKNQGPVNESIANNESETIGQAISQHRKKNRQVISTIILGIFVTIIGYSIGYKVFYRGDDIFIPLYPAPRIRKPSQTDLKKIDVDYIKRLSKIRVIEALSRHNMVKEEYGVPLHGEDNINPPKISDFDLWCEDRDPCLTGIILRRYSPNKSSTHSWYHIPFIFQWRVTHRPIYISRGIGEMLQDLRIGYSKFYEYVSPDNMYGSLKYEYPIQGDDHALSIWFLGELRLCNDTLIVYKGKYHVDVRLQRIDLLRKEKGKLVRYILFEENE